MNAAQQESLQRLVERFEQQPDSIQHGIVCEPEVVIVRFGSLWVGIEKDGYAHS